MLILQPFRHFTYVTAHYPTLPSLYLRHSSFSNTSVASPTSQLILQSFFRFSYVTGSSLTSLGEPPMGSIYHSLYYKALCYYWNSITSIKRLWIALSRHFSYFHIYLFILNSKIAYIQLLNTIIYNYKEEKI